MVPKIRKTVLKIFCSFYDYNNASNLWLFEQSQVEFKYSYIIRCRMIMQIQYADKKNSIFSFNFETDDLNKDYWY